MVWLANMHPYFFLFSNRSSFESNQIDVPFICYIFYLPAESESSLGSLYLRNEDIFFLNHFLSNSSIIIYVMPMLIHKGKK